MEGTEPNTEVTRRTRSSILWDWFHRANKATWYWRIITFHLVVWAGAQGFQAFNAMTQDIKGPQWEAMHPFDKQKIYNHVIGTVLLVVAAFLTNTASRLSDEKKQKDSEQKEIK
jgi:hypothetical protein